MLSLSGTLLVGVMVGLLARALKPGKDSLGWIMMALLGVTGAFLAMYLGIAMEWYDHGDALGWVASAVGAMVLPGLFSLVKNKA